MERYWCSNWQKDVLLYIDSWKNGRHKRSFKEVHAPCRIEFLNKSKRAFSKYEHKQTACKTFERGYGEIQEQNLVPFTRSKLDLTGNYLFHMQLEKERGHQQMRKRKNCKVFLRSNSKKKKKNLTKKATLFKGWKPSILWSFETNWYKN